MEGFATCLLTPGYPPAQSALKSQPRTPHNTSARHPQTYHRLSIPWFHPGEHVVHVLRFREGDHKTVHDRHVLTSENTRGDTFPAVDSKAFTKVLIINASGAECSELLRDSQLSTIEPRTQKSSLVPSDWKIWREDRLTKSGEIDHVAIALNQGRGEKDL